MIINHIRELINDLKNVSPAFGPVLISAVVEELNRLDPRDFLPIVQREFVIKRVSLRPYVGIDTVKTGRSWPKEQINGLCDGILKCLDSYTGENTFGKRREFNFVKDNDLRKIIERDYLELKTILFPSGAWKSVVVMAGSILEAILYDILTIGQSVLLRAAASNKAPKNKDINKGEWRLIDLINVSTDIGILTVDRACTIDQVLRDYRNFIHPKKEIKAQHECSEAEAYLAIGALDGICNYFDKKDTNLYQ